MYDFNLHENTMYDSLQGSELAGSSVFENEYTKDSKHHRRLEMGNLR